MKYQTFGIRIQIPQEDIRDLLCSASTGSLYWCPDAALLGYDRILDSIFNQEKTDETINSKNDGTIEIALPLKDEEDGTMVYLLTPQKMKKGLNIMAKKYRHHFCDFINENGDMITGDVFLQCCLLGDVIYG